MGNGLVLSVISFALPGLRTELHLSPADLGLILLMSGVGQFFGAIVVGSLADRIGRRTAFSLPSVLAGFAVAACSLTNDATTFGLLILVAGLGLGGVAPATSALLSEFAPPTYRGRMLAWTQVLWATGWSLAATVGGWFTSALGWRGILLVAAISSVVALASWLIVPESPRYLLARGRTAEAHELAQQLAERHGVLVPLTLTPRSDTATSFWAQMRVLWGPSLWASTLTLWVVWAALNAMITGPVYMMPTVLEQAGASEPLQLSAYAGYAMFPAALLAILLIDRYGRCPLTIASFLLVGVGVLGMALGRTPLVTAMGGAAVAAGSLAAWPVVLAWSGELYPTSLRGTAAGWGAGVARVGSMAAPYGLGQILALTGSLPLSLLPFMVLVAISILCVLVLAGETANRTLEELTQ